MSSPGATSTVLSGWRWRQHSADDEWHICAHSKPITEIYTDLLDAKLIPDPFVDENEKLVQWVGDADWEYACDFLDKSSNGHARQDIVFDGLDTIASVYLNDELIYESTNMFHTQRVNITGRLKDGLNQLRIVFLSALKYGQALETTKGHYRSFNGDHSRTHVRKAQYHYGWDWGPILLSCGPYREIRIESYASTINDVFLDPHISEDLEQADLQVSFDATLNQSVTVAVRAVSPSSKVFEAATTMAPTDTQDLVSLKIPKPELWYPRGYGSQVFYTVEIHVKAEDDSILKSISKRIGLRRTRLVQHALVHQPGTSFFFEINNVSIYCSGSNWIPGHSFLTGMSDGDYTAAIEAVVDGNQNMVRVWGGGVYESDIFYEECDRLGVLVWQDFMFACSRYPCYPEFAASVKKEAADQIKRLRNYCSIIIYAGNNEDYAVAEMLKLDWDKEACPSGDWTDTNFPARTIYEIYLPEAVSKYSPSVEYHFGSPWGGKDSEDPTIGDIHQWNVWHGKQEKYQLWDKLVGRFVSEFGMLAFPSAKTIRKFVSDPRQLYPQSSVLDHHNKADGSQRRLALYVMENVRVNAMDLDSWIYATQLVQAECLAFAYRSCRRGWKGPHKEYCGGVLVWQINDCWPVSSWSLIDFYGDRKLAYYAVKRESLPLCLGTNRTTPELKRLTSPPEQILGPPHDLKPKNYIFDVWAVNMTLRAAEVNVEVRLFDIQTGAVLEEKTLGPFTLQPNRTTELSEDWAVRQTTAIQAKLVDVEGNVLARMSDWPQPLKHVLLPTSYDVILTVLDGKVEIRTNAPVKGVEVYMAGEERDVQWSDNGVDVFPGDVYIIEARNLIKGDEVRVRYYGSSAA